MHQKSIKLIILVLVIIISLLHISCSKSESDTRAPIGLGYHSMAYDAESDVTIIFGGQPRDNDSTSMNETWSYRGGTSPWWPMEPETKPPESVGDPMVYDAESDRIILFTGQATWAYDHNSVTWEQMSPADTPVDLFGSSMAYDSESDRVVLFGLKALETWAYDYNNDSWELMNPSSSPDIRQYQAMAYDSESDRVVLFGGGDSISPPNFTKFYDDTWTYDYNADQWMQIESDVHPEGRVYHTMAYASKIDRVVLFGGLGENDTPSSNDIWIFDTNSGSWSIYDKNHDLEPLRKHAMVYESTSKSIVIYGGISGAVNSNATPQFSSELKKVRMR